MNNPIYDKTDKGRDEIATRKEHLPTRLRPLLLLVDGKQRADALIKKISGLGLSETSLAELLQGGFIRQVEEPAAIAEPAQPPAGEAPPEQPPSSKPVPPSPSQESAAQFQAIYNFYNETIKATIGLRGYALQLKVERASSIQELRDLRQPYLEAVLKAKGEEMAKSLRDRLDILLHGGQTPMSKA